MKQVNRLILILLFLVGFSTNKSYSQQPSSQTASIAKESRIVFLGRNVSGTNGDTIPKKIYMVCLPVPGNIIGSMTRNFLYSKVLNYDEKFEILPHIHFKALRDFAIPLPEGNVSIEPKDTKVARLGTVAYDPNTKKTLGWAGFIDKITKDIFILAYVTQPCRIKGVETVDNMRISFDIHFLEKGFNWIRYIEVDSKNVTLKNDIPKDGVDFAIWGQSE